MFRLLFNHTAVQKHFPPEGCAGVLIRLEGGNVAFQPTTDRNHNAWASGRPRSRGGYEVEIEGGTSRGAELLAVLQGLSTPSRPFFLLRLLSDGWLQPVHYAQDCDPPRSEPHMRLRVPRQELTLPLLAEHASLTYAQVVRHAAEVFTAWQAARRSGRSPAEVEDARRVLDEFTHLVTEVRPALLLAGAIDLESVRRARDALSRVLVDAGYTGEENDR